MKSRKVMVTVLEDQLRIIDGLVHWGVAPTRSALFQQIMNAFVSQTRRMIGTGAMSEPASGALEGLITYFLYSLEESVIADLFGVDRL